jgi:hypothetical protein
MRSALGLVVTVLLLSGCLGPGGGMGPGWTHDEETGVTWRHLTAGELANPAFDGFERVYVFRGGGDVADLPGGGAVVLTARVHAGFERFALEQDGETLTGAYMIRGPQGSGFLTADLARFRFDAQRDGWRYTLTEPQPEMELLPDVRPGDLVNRVRSPCVEMGPSGSNASAACQRHAELVGY